eukprot:XP_020398613.1 spidroin-1-like [Zea mays]
MEVPSLGLAWAVGEGRGRGTGKTHDARDMRVQAAAAGRGTGQRALGFGGRRRLGHAGSWATRWLDVALGRALAAGVGHGGAAACWAEEQAGARGWGRGSRPCREAASRCTAGSGRAGTAPRWTRRAAHRARGRARHGWPRQTPGAGAATPGCPRRGSATALRQHARAGAAPATPQVPGPRALAAELGRDGWLGRVAGRRDAAGHVWPLRAGEPRRAAEAAAGGPGRGRGGGRGGRAASRERERDVRGIGEREGGRGKGGWG